MQSELERARSRAASTVRTSSWGLAALLLFAIAYFDNSGSWNQNARLDAIYTFVEPGPHRGTFRIDPFLPAPEHNFNTGDWSLFNGHYFANKAPGTLLLGVLVYLPLFLLEQALGLDYQSPAVGILNAYLINLGVSALPLALAAGAWFRLLATQRSGRRALVLCLLSFLGTALFSYGTQLWGHTTAAAFCLLSWTALHSPPGAFSRLPSEAVSGGFAGLAVLCDFLAFPVVLLVLARVTLKNPRRLAWMCLGGMPSLCLLLAYQWYSFGSPFTLPTAGTRATYLDEARALGMFAAVDWQALFQLTLGPQRGLLWQMPITFVAALGYAYAAWRRVRSFDTWAPAAAFTLTLLLVASFNGWHGGATVCARYLIVALPWLCFGLSQLPKHRLASVALALAGALSCLSMLAVAAVSPLAPDRMKNPLLDFIAPYFWTGRLHPVKLPTRLQALDPDFPAWGHLTVWNLGDIVGLGGLWRLLPWLFVVLSGGYLLWKRLGPSPSAGPSLAAASCSVRHFSPGTGYKRSRTSKSS